MLQNLKALRTALAAFNSVLESQAIGSRFGASGASGEGAVAEDALDLLGLVIASLEKLELQALDPAVCQVAVLGPTQAGKSTLVNLLVGSEVTTVSALAGHTRHARGAALGVDEAVLERIADALAPARRVPASNLSADNLDQYSLVPVSAAAVADAARSSGPVAEDSSVIVWDTPDFDSLAADTYRRAVLAIAGLADVIVLIVSRDKYGDMAVWELLERVALLDRRAVFVVNKVDPFNWDELREHVLATQQERLQRQAFSVACMHHTTQGQTIDGQEVFAQLGGLTPVGREQLQASIRTLLARGTPAWTAPLRAEEAACQSYLDLVALRKDEFMASYRRDYLADAERYDTFQRLLGELLILLEIPALARTMGSVRRVVTWPVRKLFGSKEAENSLGREPELLVEGASHLLLNLRMSALEASEPNPFWNKVARRLSAEHTGLVGQFQSAAETHHDEFQASVANAAQTLYQNLQETPALLNSLRAIRASADTAGVVVALQTGGIGLADLVLTPVMLSLTTTLTESAAKTYVDTVVSDLQEEQYAAVNTLFDKGLGATLGGYANDTELRQFSQFDANTIESYCNDF